MLKQSEEGGGGWGHNGGVTVAADRLALGPLLRFVGHHEATVWVQTTEPAWVEVELDDRVVRAPTFIVEDHHYALVVITGLEPGTQYPYRLRLDGEVVWPAPDSPFPPPTIRTLTSETPTRLAFGSCRTSVPHDAEHHASHGVDAMRAYALALAKGEQEWPDAVAFLGDQVYADETSEAMREFIASRRDITKGPKEELADFAEYSHLYHLAWSDPANRWLLANLPSAMIFDDHDVRDDWNTSYEWHQEINALPWWHERLIGALTSYWVYQQIGNLAPEELAEDPYWALVTKGETPGKVDLTEALRSLAERVDREPESYRWSYTRDLGDTRLIVVDSRAARVLEPDHRDMLDPGEMDWFREQMRGDVDHLFIGTSLPFLLAPGLHDFEAIDEELASPERSAPVRWTAEHLRQVIDLEHWAAFQTGFAEVFEEVMAVARGERGKPPATITFLSGDVHHSYVAEVTDADQYGARSRIVQAVCSPIRNPMPRAVRVVMSLFARALVRPMRWASDRAKGVDPPRYPWTVTHGPWFDNNIAVAQVKGERLTVTWHAGEVVDGDDAHPALVQVAEATVG